MVDYTRLCQRRAPYQRAGLWPGLLLLVLTSLCVPASAEIRTIDSLSVPIALDEPWQFKPGDEPDWAQPLYNDSEWQQLSPLRSWTRQGFGNYSGFGAHPTCPPPGPQV